MSAALDALAEPWRSDRLLLGDRGRWSVPAAHEADGALLLVLALGERRSLLGRGDPRAVRALLERAPGPVDWATLPRLGAGPRGAHGAPEDDGPLLAPEADLPGSVRQRLGVQPATAWDWMATTVPPTTTSSAAADVVLLDPVRDLSAILDCLAEANPTTQADPAGPAEAAWFGVRDGRRLLGVIGAATRPGDPRGADLSWHLHGLGVRPDARGRGLGGALTAAATRAGFAAGTDWVSLGLYASNVTARRVYLRLGFEVEGRFSSYRPAAGADLTH